MRLMCVNNNLPRSAQGKQLSKYAYNKLQNAQNEMEREGEELKGDSEWRQKKNIYQVKAKYSHWLIAGLGTTCLHEKWKWQRK